jgi:hypothetical protein
MRSGLHPALGSGEHGQDRRRRAPIASKIAAFSLVVVLGLAALGVRSELQFREFSQGLDAHVATYKRQRWERPVLRGPATPGNAHDAIVQALHGFAGLSFKQRDALASQLYYGQLLSAEQRGLLTKHASMIGKLRLATLSGWTMTQVPLEKVTQVAAPAYPPVMDAALLMLAQATTQTPDECLSQCADVIRVGQDMVPGAPLEAASLSMRITSTASAVLLRCASRSDVESVLRASRELRTLATHAPPSGSGIELADLVAAMKLRDLSRLLGAEGDDSFATRLRRRPALFAAWRYFDNPARWRALTPDHYPQALENWQREQEWRTRAELPLVADATDPVVGWLYDDMRGQALLRELTIGLATRAERMRRGRTPREPVLLQEPQLRDPFTGEPLKWRFSQDGAELTLWSLGEDRRDDKAAGDWRAQAPVDVVVHVPLMASRQLEAARAAADSTL